MFLNPVEQIQNFLSTYNHQTRNQTDKGLYNIIIVLNNNNKLVVSNSAKFIFKIYAKPVLIITMIINYCIHIISFDLQQTETF